MGDSVESQPPGGPPDSTDSATGGDERASIESTSEVSSGEGGAVDEEIKATLAPEELSNSDMKSIAFEPLGDVALPPRRETARGEKTIGERSSWTGSPLKMKSKDPLLGTTLHDTYVVLRVLGEGGMGRVYEARHTRIQTKRYAIKVLHSEFSLDPNLRLRFQREAEAAATIEHDGVVGTYDLGQTPQGWPYMVCEYLAGEDLNSYLKKRGPLPAETVVHIGRQLCSALRSAHVRGVIHRDLKPHNVFVLQERSPSLENEEQRSDAAANELPAVKVLDFGLSRFVENDSELTKTGIILGTPGYMAPEQANGLDTDLRADIYGIGALLFAAATGRAPFKENTPQLTVLAVMSRQPPRPRELVPSLPEDLEIVIQKAMAKEPKERYQSAAEMEAALSQLQAASGQHLWSGGAAQAAPVAVSRSRLLLLTAGGALFGGVSLLSALLGFLEIKGVQVSRFRPIHLEGLLLLLLLLFLVLLSVIAAVRRFRHRVWNNSARVAELVPKVRAPLVAAMLAYGVSALIVRTFAGFDGMSEGGLSRSSLPSTVVWYVVLPLNAAFAASAVLLRDTYRTAKNPVIRHLTTTGYSAGVFGAGLCLLGLALAWPAPERAFSKRDEPVLSPLAVSVTPEEALAAVEPSQEAVSAPEVSDNEEAQEPEVSSEEADGEEEEREETVPQFAPSDDVAIATEDGAEALELLSKQYPDDSEVLKALVLAHASRADTLDRSVLAISRLLSVEPGFKKDVDVLFILNKALRTKGKVSALALSVLKKDMGTDGADLLYEIMSEQPEYREAMKEKFHELRRAKRASNEVLIAYDLKYASSCKGRLNLLDRAEKVGDIRSLRQLQALSLKPKRCGGWGRTCTAPCPVEAKRFQRSAKKISQRLAEAEVP